MTKADYEKLRDHINANTDIVVMYADRKEEKVTINKKKTENQFVNTPFVASHICTCHWADVQACINGYHYARRYGSHLTLDSSTGEATIERLEDLGFCLTPDPDDCNRFHIYARESNGWLVHEGGTMGKPNEIYAYSYMSQVECWLKGLLYGIAERNAAKSSRG